MSAAETWDVTARAVGAMANAVGRECDTCSLCCKVMSIEKDAPGAADADIIKPAGQWCRHCRPGRGGCSIYETRPAVCRAFTCLWLVGFGSAEWCPQRSKMVVTPEPDGGLRIYVDDAYPGAWMKAPYYADIKACAADAPVWLTIGYRRAIILLWRNEQLELLEGDRVFPGSDGRLCIERAGTGQPDKAP